jgi:hypothetical protein
MTIFIKAEELKARKDNREMIEINPDTFHTWATKQLKSPRSIWLYSMCVSAGSMLVVLRAAIRFE